MGRPKSVKLIEEAVQHERPIAILTQRNPEQDEPGIKDIYHIGTMARILKVVKIASDNYNVIIQGQERIKLYEMTGDDPSSSASSSASRSRGRSGARIRSRSRRCL